MRAAWFLPRGLFSGSLALMSEDRRNPAEAEHLLTGALRALQAGDFDAAEALCRRALALQNGSIRAYAALGAVFHGKGAYAEAEGIFDELARHQPREPTHWMNLGTARRG